VAFAVSLGGARGRRNTGVCLALERAEMAEGKLERSVQLGLLDRLIDLEPENRNEAPVSRSESLRRLRNAVKRDLEYLLNTTRLPLDIPEGCPESARSILTYGLPDVSGVSLQDPGAELRLFKGLESAIELFEPRLTKVRVTCVDPDRSNQHSLTFHVEALLMIDPAPERIAFDTVLDITKGAYSVKED
jgi:type VI secretion system protein ImpF